MAAGVVVLVGGAYWAGMKKSDGDVASHPETQAGSAASTPPAASPPFASASASATPAAAAASASARGPFDTTGLDGLASKLTSEKAASGKSDPNAAGVFKAIEEKLKIPLEGKLQVLGLTVAADFCERMNTKHDVYVVVCEYKDEAAAKVGQKKGANDVVKKREVLQRRNATCAVHRAGDSKEADDEAKRIKDLFLAM